MSIAATLQLCTYNRAHLLARVLDACFEQNLLAAEYEVVLVNDGSRDDTERVIASARSRAPVAFTAITQPNGGLARARNTGIAAARGERIIFIDDDVLPMPNFVGEHLRASARRPNAVVRGAVIEVDSFDKLPAPFWTPRNYSGNWFWTSNVSVSRRRLDAVKLGDFQWFDESFSEYGWEDIELGLRLREAGTRGVFNRHAVAFHYKPKSARVQNVEDLVRQKRAQARTALILERKHPGWRVRLATGNNGPARSLHRVARTLRIPRGWRGVAADAYFDELERGSS
ncbi:MAG: glycosyltransferase [Candidatus Eremiobacteraeota bacterium]|nr:glycosyltransferase [Candidatus Eremiobacteraeota bacterium]